MISLLQIKNSGHRLIQKDSSGFSFSFEVLVRSLWPYFLSRNLQLVQIKEVVFFLFGSFGLFIYLFVLTTLVPVLFSAYDW